MNKTPKQEKEEKCRYCKTRTAQIHGLCKECCPCCETPNKKEENNTDSRSILFDFWEAYQNKDADKRDEAIEKAVNEIDNLLQSQKDNLTERTKRMENTREMEEMEGIKFTRGWNKAVKSFLSLIQEQWI